MKLIDMFSGKQIIVPNYQRAYAWDTALKAEVSPKQVNIFLSDLEKHLHSGTTSNYYLGHFLFEKKIVDNKEIYCVVDGQQRMTTTVIFTSVVLKILESKRKLNDYELDVCKKILKNDTYYVFQTVDYDKQTFIDIVLEYTTLERDKLETESSKRIYDAYYFFLSNLSSKSEKELEALLKLIMGSSCTTHTVKSESDAIQMFIFQNNRGKKPTDLEVIKAQFMFYINLYAGEKKPILIETIKERFKEIYYSISEIEHKIDEDEVLRYVVRVYFNNLWETASLEKITKTLEESSKNSDVKENGIYFITTFTKLLSDSFKSLRYFYTGEKERKSLAIHYLLVVAGKIGVAMPFILKAYLSQISFEDKEKLCTALADLLLRDRIIGTRAELESRLKNIYMEFAKPNNGVITSKGDVEPILKHIDYLKTVPYSENSWSSYWNNEELKRCLPCLKAAENSKLICILLWKYEVYLHSKGKAGYEFYPFNSIEKPEVEHIAPRTEREERKASGYGNYTEKFRNECLDSWGNYLLISKSHNCSIGNLPFSEKLKSYKELKQQVEIKDFVGKTQKWDSKSIKLREEKLLSFFLENL